ncbi:hypothetical protein D3C80_1606510 [compost metagenome]
MAITYQVREELQEECHDQQTNVHPIDIGIGCNYNVVVSQAIHTVFNIQRVLQQVEFFILIYHFFGKTKTVQRLTSQTEYSLRFYITAFGNRSARGVTLSNENSGCQLLFL